MAQLSPRLRARLARVPDVARAAAAKAMEEGAAEIVAEMKRLAPVLKEPDGRRRAGALRDSINYTWGEVPAGTFVIDEIRSGKNAGDQYATLRIKIYAGNKEAFYARWVEFGTAAHSVAQGADLSRSKNQQNPRVHPGAKAHPFFYPAWAKHKAAFRRRIREQVRRAIREAFANG